MTAQVDSLTRLKKEIMKGRIPAIVKRAAELERGPVKLPELGDTEASIREYLGAVARAVADGTLNTKAADTLVTTAKASLAALKQQNAKEEIKRLQQMLKQAQELARQGKVREASDRLGQDADVAVSDEDEDDEEDED